MKDLAPLPQVPLRPAAQVMRLARMGASFPTRLSFLRTLLRRLAAEKAQVGRELWQIDSEGHGRALYTVALGGHRYSLVAISTPLAPEQRSDRVIAEAWDTSYVLYDGVPDAGELERIAATAPLQEAARFTPRDLVLSRANRSVRLFDATVAALRAGRAPDAAALAATGYLMRTTAVYGNGKFGIADRARIADRPGLGGPFMAEMLAIWLIRGFTHDLVEHVGQGRLGRAARRGLGIGNSTGLGMAPFLVSHPLLLNAWITARETALARVRALESLPAERAARLSALAGRVGRHLEGWQVSDPQAMAAIEALRTDWAALGATLAEDLRARRPIDRLVRATGAASLEVQELLAALVLEPFGDLVDDLSDGMAVAGGPVLDPAMPCAVLRRLIEAEAGWALGRDYAAPGNCALFWYVSEEKLEPRLGLRHSEPGAERESPLDVARRIAALHAALAGQAGQLAGFLARHPEHRFAARRVQALDRHPYAEIRDNLIASDCRPIDMLRCKLAFFGAARFDPKSDRWTRITLAQGAPLFDELDAGADDWWLPDLP